MSEITIDDVLKNAGKSEEVQSIKTATKRAGRPPKGSSAATKRVVIYLTPEQLEEIEDHCHKTRQKVGTFIKETFFEGFKGEKKEANEIEKFIENLNEREIGEVVKNYLLGK
jgi:guanylate kinase